MQYVRLILDSVRYFGRYAVYIVLFSSAAGIARAMQVGALGEVESWLNACLEIIVNLARLGVLLVLIGQGDAKMGVRRVLKLNFAIKAFVRQEYKTMYVAVKLKIAVINGLLFAGLIWGLNALFASLADAVASHTTAAFLSEPGPIVFFLKNLTVIPLTTIFVLCLVNLFFYNRTPVTSKRS